MLILSIGEVVQMGRIKTIKGRADLMCEVERIGYDVRHKLGWIHLPDGYSANGEGVFRLFLDIDPEVQRILVYSGGMLEFIHQKDKRSGEWKVTCPKDPIIFE